MPISVRDASLWKTAEPYVRDAGVWKPVDLGYVRDGGAWKEFHTSVPPVELVGSAYAYGLDISVPAHQSGDLLVLFMGNNNYEEYVPTAYSSSGWTHVRSATAAFGGNRRATVSCLWRIGNGTLSTVSGYGWGSSNTCLAIRNTAGIGNSAARQVNATDSMSTQLPATALVSNKSMVLGSTQDALVSSAGSMVLVEPQSSPPRSQVVRSVGMYGSFSFPNTPVSKITNSGDVALTVEILPL